MGLLSELSAQIPFSASFHLRFLGYDIPLVVAFLAVFITSRVIKFFNGLHAVSYLPGYRVPLQPLSLPSGLIPTYWWNMGPTATWKWRDTLYNDFGSESISAVPYLQGVSTIYSSNLDVIRQVIAGGDQKTIWKKSVVANRVLVKWGLNLVGVVEMDVWRKHRRIVGPAFNNKLYEMVWAETLNIYRQMESVEGFNDGDSHRVPVIQKLTTKMALLIIAKCGFGLSFDWAAPPETPDGKMSIQEALRTLADNHAVALAAPDWVRYLPLPGFGKIRQAFDQFSAFMRKEIIARVAEVQSDGEDSSDKADAFTLLVRANEQETGKLRLDDREVIGNVFIFLFAGHETTANTLAATIAMLALHPEVQSEILEHIVSVVGYDRDPVYEDYDKLDKVLATFYEGSRMFPPAYLTIREANQDIVLNLPNPVGQEGSTPLPVAKGTMFVTDMIGLHYNPRYFADPDTFRPSRWYGESNETEMYAVFSIGPRTCIGKKFALVEVVAFLTMLIRDWQIEPALQEGETRDDWKNRVTTDPKMVLTMVVADMAVKLTRRKRA